MSDAETILKMIEDVDPSDTAALDEIDARFWCFLYQCVFMRERGNGWQYKDSNHARGVFLNRSGNRNILYMDNTKRYTRSRDALKSIRLSGWYFNIGHNESNSGGLFACSMYSHTNSPVQNSPDLPTEELAELHAIIQSIEWERNNDR